MKINRIFIALTATLIAVSSCNSPEKVTEKDEAVISDTSILPENWNQKKANLEAQKLTGNFEKLYYAYESEDMAAVQKAVNEIQAMKLDVTMEMAEVAIDYFSPKNPRFGEVIKEMQTDSDNQILLSNMLGTANSIIDNLATYYLSNGLIPDDYLPLYLKLLAKKSTMDAYGYFKGDPEYDFSPMISQAAADYVKENPHVWKNLDLISKNLYLESTTTEQNDLYDRFILDYENFMEPFVANRPDSVSEEDLIYAWLYSSDQNIVAQALYDAYPPENYYY